MPLNFFSRRTRVCRAGLMLIGLLCTATPGLAQGLLDGFNKGQGRLDLALSYSWEQYASFFVGDMKMSEPGLGDITTQSVSLYAAYGLTSQIDLVVNLPFISATSSQNPDLNESAFQDLSLCVKGHFLTHRFAGSTMKVLGGLGLSAPTSRYAIDAPVAIGHRATHLDGRLIAQLESDRGYFLAVQTGYTWKSDVTIAAASIDVPATYDVIARAGFGARRIYADLWGHLQRAGSGTDIGMGIPFPSNAISFFRVGGNVFTPITASFGLTAGAGYTLSGENVGKAFRVSGGLVYRMR